MKLFCLFGLLPVAFCSPVPYGNTTTAAVTPYAEFESALDAAESSQRILNAKLNEAVQSNSVTPQLLSAYAADCDALLSNVSSCVLELYNDPPETACELGEILVTPYCNCLADGAKTVTEGLSQVNGTVDWKTSAAFADNYQRLNCLATAFNVDSLSDSNFTSFENLQAQFHCYSRI